MCACTRSHTFPTALQFEVWRISWPWWDRQEWDVCADNPARAESADEYLGLPPRGVIGSPRNLS